MSVCTFSCKSHTCKYIIYGYIRQLENEYTFARIISQSIMDLCFIFWHQYLLQLQIPQNASLFTLLFATYHLRDALLFGKWYSLNPLTQYQIANCFKLDQQEQSANLDTDAFPRFTKTLTENVLIYYNMNVYSDIYKWLTTIFSNFQYENKLLSTIKIMEYTAHDLVISFIHFIINDETNIKNKKYTIIWEFIEYVRRYFSCMMYNGAMICKEVWDYKSPSVYESNMINTFVEDTTGITPPPQNTTQMFTDYYQPNESKVTSWWNLKVTLPDNYQIPDRIIDPVTPETPEYIVKTADGLRISLLDEDINNEQKLFELGIDINEAKKQRKWKLKIDYYGPNLMDSICQKYKLESVRFRVLEKIFNSWLCSLC
eukprot:266228_1